MNALTLAEEIINGRRITREDDLSFFLTCDLEELCEGADRIREVRLGDKVDLCSIINGRSGRCPEDCKYCAQSAHHHTNCEEYDFLPEEEILAACKMNEREGVDRFSIVTAGRALTGEEFDKAIHAYETMKKECKIDLCASMGFLSAEQLHRLHEAGVTSYHHNIETSRRNFPNICTTHTYDMKIETLKKVKVGSTITGTIVEINGKGEIFVDIGYKADGIIPRNEYFSEKGLEPADEYKVGDKIKADVLKLNDGQGNVLMSCKHAKIKEIRKEFKEKVDNKEVFEEEVKQTNKNGLVVLYKNLIRVFIPISLSEVGRDEDVSSYKGKTIRFRVIENDERAKKIIGSVKDLVEEEKKAKEEEFWNNIEVGKKYTGTVTAISDYGAFVDIGGAQGLLHISEMTWGRNQNPRDILEVGQSIEVSVKELDKENKRFKLSYEKKGPNPWNKVEEKYHVGDVVKVKISKIMPFGAFAELEKGIEGLVHISQICERKIAKPEEELQVGQKVNAKIINIDFENKKIELSIRELEGTSQEYKENA